MGFFHNTMCMELIEIPVIVSRMFNRDCWILLATPKCWGTPPPPLQPRSTSPPAPLHLRSCPSPPPLRSPAGFQTPFTWVCCRNYSFERLSCHGQMFQFPSTWVCYRKHLLECLFCHGQVDVCVDFCFFSSLVTMQHRPPPPPPRPCSPSAGLSDPPLWDRSIAPPYGTGPYPHVTNNCVEIKLCRK